MTDYNFETLVKADGGNVKLGASLTFMNSTESVFRYPAAFKNRVPYPHVILEDVFDDVFLRECLDELKTSMAANFKETDLFKVYQTADLANLEICVNETARVRNLLRLRDFLYSSNFREFVEATAGCDGLDGVVDCSCNLYTPSCHLLCHDDVIGKRKISYVIYLTDPDEEWLESDGGQLELYGLDSDMVSPHSKPEISILPKWNSMIMFQVLPGQSFHAVREVRSQAKTRVSISGWFHTMSESDIDSARKSLSTLQQLRARSSNSVQNIQMERMFSSVVHDMHIHLNSLSRWINPEYLSQDGMEKVRQYFAEQKSVQLLDFMLPNIANELKTKIEREECRNRRESQFYEYGIGLGWKVQGPPQLCRYLKYEPSSSNVFFERSKLGDLLENIKNEVFSSEAFAVWIQKITGSSCQLYHSEVRRFRPGFDYTLAHDSRHGQNEIHVNACFTDGTKRSWDSGDIGGYTCFMQTGEDNEIGADVYEDENMNDGLQSVSASFNGLSIVHLSNDVTNFVKYVSAFAPRSRWDIVSRLQIVYANDQI